MADADDRAWRIAEAAARAWHASNGGHDVAVPVGVVAALALVARGPAAAPARAAWYSTAGDDVIAAALRQAWARFWVARPELARLVGPFASWLDSGAGPPALAVAAAAATARAAAAHGLFDFAGRGFLRDADVIGATYLHLSPPRAQQAQGESYTPPDACLTAARLLLAAGVPGPGHVFNEPACGTGGMLRATAEVLRDHGASPAQFGWTGTDANPVAVAGLAVNAHLWDLGPHVLFAAADIIKSPDWQPAAVRSALEAVRERGQYLAIARAVALTGPPREPGPPTARRELGSLPP